ncbi:hypothetical protein [Myceligenerans crystallogenes]|uniref:HEAT repeat-containing protein n=1 Tax=Myceligenerans crystallogenes TaxID=316335 RepID=A0ABN2NIY4_9MICO
MLDGLDALDWGSMSHAYGSADDVPPLLRGLVSPDRATREGALDALLMGVHHQGDVYDSTVACLPFLVEIMCDRSVPDRAGVVELVADIGAPFADELDDDEGEDEDDDDVDDHTGEADETDDAEAAAFVRAHAHHFAELLRDPDPDVRRAAATPAVRFGSDPQALLTLLLSRLNTDDPADLEPEPRVTLALIKALGLLARTRPERTSVAAGRLATFLSEDIDPTLRLTALVATLRLPETSLPGGLVDSVLAMMADRPVLDVRPSSEQRPATDTLVGHLRVLMPDDEAQDMNTLLRGVHDALGARTDERIHLLCGQLTSPHPADRLDAASMASGLFGTFRADYDRPVRLIGGMLTEPDPRWREAAATRLESLFHLAAPAADDLARYLDDNPDARVQRYRGGPPNLGAGLIALSRCGDARAVPHLAAVLESDGALRSLGSTLKDLGHHAGTLTPLLLAEAGHCDPDRQDDAEHIRLSSTLTGLSFLREPAAEPVARAYLEGLHRILLGGADVGRTFWWRAGDAVRTLADLGTPVSADCLRPWLGTKIRLQAAEALLTLTGGPGGKETDAVIDVVEESLSGPRPQDGAALAGRLGRAGERFVPRLRTLLRASGPDDGPGWHHSAKEYAVALWQITGDHSAAVEPLRTAWAENVHTRPAIAGFLAGIGAASRPLRDLLEVEVAATRRFNAIHLGGSSHAIQEDERLRTTCLSILESLD